MMTASKKDAPGKKLTKTRAKSSIPPITRDDLALSATNLLQSILVVLNDRKCRSGIWQRIFSEDELLDEMAVDVRGWLDRYAGRK